MLISTALCNNLKQNDPSGEVHYLVMDYCAGMAQGNPNIDRLIIIEKARRNQWRYMKDLLLAIRRERYDVVVNSQGQMIGLLSCLFSGARLRIGFDSFPGGSATTASCAFAKTPNSRATAPWLTIASRCSSRSSWPARIATTTSG